MSNSPPSVDKRKKTAVKLTPKQVRFIEVYSGNGTEAARLAGYSGNDAVLGQVAYENLNKPEIAQAIDERAKRTLSPLIANREERQEFWTEIMRDVMNDPFARMKASELLGKSEADFIDKVKHEGHVTLAELVAGSHKDKS